MKRRFLILLLLCAALCASLCVLTACKSGHATSGEELSSESASLESGVSEPEGNPEGGLFLPGRIEILGEGRAVMRAADVSFEDSTLTLTVNGRILCALKFDGAGNPVEEHYYPQNGGEQRTVREYEGDLLRKETVYEGDYRIVSETVYTYDGAGNLQASDKTGENAERWESEYDANGNCVKATRFRDGEQLQVTYAYDAQGRLVREAQDGAGAALNAYEYSYDEAGRLDRIYSYQFHWVEGIGVHTYDGEGRLTDLTWIDSDGNAFYDRYTYDYDENGRLVLEMEYTDYDYPWHKYTYAYDGDGNRTEHLTWVEWSGDEEDSESEWVVKEGIVASGFFRANITEGEYREILRFLSENGYAHP